MRLVAYMHDVGSLLAENRRVEHANCDRHESPKFFLWLTRTASRTCRARAHEIVGLSISEIDVAREVLLNFGGILNLDFDAPELERRCGEALEAVVARRKSLPECLLVTRSALDLSLSVVQPIDEQVAVAVHRGLHYLGMPRHNSTHLGLFGEKDRKDTTHLLGVFTVSAFDLFGLVPSVINANEAKNSAVVSRITLLPGSIKNTASRLIGESCKWLRTQKPELQALYTYNNPNLAFRGTIYRATNWQLVATEQKLPDYKLDGRYVSRRELTRIVGQALDTEFADYFGARLSPLPSTQLPLEVYRIGLHSRRRSGVTS
jgi:hypothetical protein